MTVNVTNFIICSALQRINDGISLISVYTQTYILFTENLNDVHYSHANALQMTVPILMLLRAEIGRTILVLR